MSLPKTAKIISISVVSLVLFSGVYLWDRSPADASLQYTNDAYIQADFTLLSPRVSGQIDRVLVENNQVVQAGQLLASIDDRDLNVTVKIAQASVDSAQAMLESLKVQRQRQDLLIEQASASILANKASIELAELNLTRYQSLSTQGAGSKQNEQTAYAQLHIQKANLQGNQAAHQASILQAVILDADLKKATAQLHYADAMLDQAKLNLSYTQIIAPISGILDRNSLRKGTFVSVGAPLLAIVPLDLIYIDAKYRETQLENIKPGQHVSIKIDALPNIIFTGKVASLAPASGVTFSPIAPQNATGNFTKITQRLSVRIEFDPNQEGLSKLRVGMSVQPSIDTKL